MTLALAVVSAILAIPLLTTLYTRLPTIIEFHNFDAFFLGSVTGAIFGLVIFFKVPILATFEHEFTHLCVALCLFRKPIRFVVHADGGEVAYKGRGSILIRLGPYVLPTFTLIILLIVHIAQLTLSTYEVAGIASTWGYHLATGILESTPRQMDLRRGGLIASYAAIICLCSIIYPTTAFWVMDESSMVWRWFGDSWIHAMDVIALGD